jgi:hypothetical protein
VRGKKKTRSREKLARIEKGNLIHQKIKERRKYYLS